MRRSVPVVEFCVVDTQSGGFGGLSVLLWLKVREEHGRPASVSRRTKHLSGRVKRRAKDVRQLMCLCLT